MAEGGCAVEKTFTFCPLPSRTFTFLQDRETRSLLMKWSMLGRLSAEAFIFDQNYFPYCSQSFAHCFFTDANVMSSLKKAESRARVPLDKPVESVRVEAVPCSATSLDLFDPLYSCGVLRPGGDIVRCFHDVHGDCDELRLVRISSAPTSEARSPPRDPALFRQMLLDEECEHHGAVSEDQRRQFLFRVFRHLCLGGELCQSEERVEPYVRTAKHIYKDLVSVQKDPETKKISVVSTVLKVSAFDESGPCFPGRPEEEEQTFAYLIIDPYKKHVTLFYHIYGIGDFSF